MTIAMRTHVRMIACLAVLAAGAPLANANAVSGEGFLDEVIAHAAELLAKATAARQPKPPVGVALQWRTANRGSFDSDWPLLALETTNLDGVAGEELIALTTGEVLVFSLKDQATLLARAPIEAQPAIIRSRDPVGTISLAMVGSSIEIAVRTSEHHHGMRYVFASGALTVAGQLEPDDGFPLCAGLSALLEPGRNSFDPKSLRIADGAWPAGLARPAKPFYRVECRSLVSSDGRKSRVVGVTGLDRELRVSCDRGDQPCLANSTPIAKVGSAGVAFEIADLNRDGYAEVTTALGKAPQAEERLRVHGRSAKMIINKKLDLSVVATSAVDVAGDGRRHLYFAVRSKTDHRIHLWTLNRHP